MRAPLFIGTALLIEPWALKGAQECDIEARLNSQGLHFESAKSRFNCLDEIVSHGHCPINRVVHTTGGCEKEIARDQAPTASCLLIDDGDTGIGNLLLAMVGYHGVSPVSLHAIILSLCWIALRG